LQSWKARLQPRHQLEAVQVRHPDVDDGQFGMELGGH